MTKKFRIRNTSKYNYWAIQFKHARSIWSAYDPERKKCIENSRIKIGNIFKFKCFHCPQFVLKEEFEVDHVIPIGNSQPQTRFDYFKCLDKLLVSVEQLQILCHPCHTNKTNREKEERKK